MPTFGCTDVGAAPKEARGGVEGVRRVRIRTVYTCILCNRLAVYIDEADERGGSQNTQHSDVGDEAHRQLSGNSCQPALGELESTNLRTGTI